MILYNHELYAVVSRWGLLRMFRAAARRPSRRRTSYATT
jgi:hypothetical protein